MANPSLWSHETFAGHFKSSPRKAFEYRRDTLGDPIPTEWMTPEEKEAFENGTTLPETNPQDTETLTNILNLDLTKKPFDLGLDLTKKDEPPKDGYSIEQLRALLREKGIPFFGGATPEKLAELCIEHNLI